GEHRGQRAEYSAQRHRGTKAVTGIIPLHAQVTIELALDEAGQLRQTPLHRAEVPIRSAEEHPSRLKIAVQELDIAQEPFERGFPNEIVERPHERRANVARHTAVAKIGIGPLAGAGRKVDARDRARLEEVELPCFDGELNILRRTEVALDRAGDAFDLGPVLLQQRMTRR